LRAVAEIEEGRAGETRIIVSEMPYQTSIASVSKKIEDWCGRRPRRIAEARTTRREQDPPGDPAQA